MIQWWWLIVALFIGFWFGFFVYALMKIAGDTDRLWQGYYEKLEKEKKNDSISNVQ